MFSVTIQLYKNKTQMWYWSKRRILNFISGILRISFLVGIPQNWWLKKYLIFVVMLCSMTNIKRKTCWKHNIRTCQTIPLSFSEVKCFLWRNSYRWRRFFGLNPTKALRERLKDINKERGYNLVQSDQIMLSLIGQNFVFW